MSEALLFCLAASVLAFVAGLSFYLAAHQQQIMTHRPSSRPCILAGGLFTTLALIGFSAATDILVGAFMTGVALMLVLSLLPVIVALHRAARS